jgi:hypothetical protein
MNMLEKAVPLEIQKMDEIMRQARRDFPQPTNLDSRYLATREVAELRRLIELPSSETELDEFLSGEPNLLSSLLHFASTGHHGGKVFPQQVIRPTVKGIQKGLIPDYLISGESSDGTSWWVLELKSPSAKIFSGSDDTLRLSNTANKGVLQINNYVEFCNTHQSALREALKLENFSTPIGILLIGRESELNSPHLKQMKKSLGGATAKIRIRTWDSLLRSLEHKLAFYGHNVKDPLRNERLLEDW